MGRSATLCGGKHNTLLSTNWDSVKSHREALNEQLGIYLAGKACVSGAPISARINGTFLDALSLGFVSVLKEELNNLDRQDIGIGSAVSFARIYTEMWRQATLIPTKLNGAADSDVVWVDVEPATQLAMIDIKTLQALNDKWKDWKGNLAQNDQVVVLACNLADAYLKVMEECRISAQGDDAGILKHHMEILGDVFQEMLALHATLLPKKESRLSEST